jgi:hypothetical protein
LISAAWLLANVSKQFAMRFYSLFIIFLFSAMDSMAQDQVIQAEDLIIQVSSDCSLDAPIPTFMSPCEGIVEVKTVDKHFSGGCAGTVERTYMASDACGNTLNVMQYIKIDDDVPPVFTMEYDTIRVASLQNVRLSRPLAEDDCGKDLKWETSDEDYDDGQERGLRRTFIVTDDCGNSSTSSMIILVQD